VEKARRGEEDKIDWRVGNPLTFHDTLSTKYGSARFGQNEGFHGALVTRFGLLKRRPGPLENQAERDLFQVFCAMHSLAKSRGGALPRCRCDRSAHRGRQQRATTGTTAAAPSSGRLSSGPRPSSDSPRTQPRRIARGLLAALKPAAGGFQISARVSGLSKFDYPSWRCPRGSHFWLWHLKNPRAPYLN